MIRFLIFMSILTFLMFSNFRRFFIKHLRQKRHLLKMFSRKCQVQNDRTNWEKISCFCQKLDLTLYFTIKTSIFKLRPLFRFLCLINSFYRRYVSCIYNIYPIYPIYPLDLPMVANSGRVSGKQWQIVVELVAISGKQWQSQWHLVASSVRLSGIQWQVVADLVAFSGH